MSIGEGLYNNGYAVSEFWTGFDAISYKLKLNTQIQVNIKNWGYKYNCRKFVADNLICIAKDLYV